MNGPMSNRCTTTGTAKSRRVNKPVSASSPTTWFKGKGGGVYLDEGALLVHPDVAAKVVAEVEVPATPAGATAPGAGIGKKTSSSSSMMGVQGAAPKEAPLQRFHGAE